VGEPRVLDSLMMFADPNGVVSAGNRVRYVSPTGNDATGNGSAANPFATIMRAARAIQDASGIGKADGGTIYLEAGDHIYGSYSFSQLTATANRWLTITAAPGVPQTAARLVQAGSSDGLRTKLVHLRGLTLAPASGAAQTILTSNGGLEDYLWVDDCNLVGPGRTVDAGWSSGWTNLFITDSNVSHSRDGLGGVLVRNVTVSDIGSDAFSNSGIVINSKVSGINSTGSSFHADVLQYFGNELIENRIVYGLTAIESIGAQGLFAGSNIAIKDVAFVNVVINNSPSIMYAFQFGGPTSHLFVAHSSFSGAAEWRQDLGFTASNVLIEDTFFSNSLPLVDGVTVR
jgi:hypothetical protein